MEGKRNVFEGYYFDYSIENGMEQKEPERLDESCCHNPYRI